MNIREYERKIFTYVAGDWDGDNDAIEQLETWNEGKKWSLHFYNVHKVTQSKDSTRNCNIKNSLWTRMSKSSKFILVVGSNTRNLRSGSCSVCPFYVAPSIFSFAPESKCMFNDIIDNRSFVAYEVDLALQALKTRDMKIVVLYNSVNINEDWCPNPLKGVGTHATLKKRVRDACGNWHFDWDYDSVKQAIIG